LQWNISRSIRLLKQESGRDILIYGSGELVRTLLSHDEIDVLRLMIHPVFLGWGTRLLEDVHRSGLTLVDTNATEKGVATLTYQVTRS
jgi:dihydrofolate reductase